jgi:hypothetical protein
MNHSIQKLLRRELQAVLKLAPWLLLSLLLAAFLWHADLNAVSGLFQSPATPTATLPPTATEEPSPVPTEPPLTPTEVVTPTATATLAPTATPTPEIPAGGSATPTDLPPASPTPTQPPPTPAGDENPRYTDDADLAYDWGMLFDSVALGLSYIWLCCGVLLLLAVPVFFVVLWVMGKRRQEQEE